MQSFLCLSGTQHVLSDKWVLNLHPKYSYSLYRSSENSQAEFDPFVMETL